MAQRLSTGSLPEHQRLVPRTHFRQLTAICNSSSWDLMPLASKSTCILVQIPTCRYPRPYTVRNNNKSFFFKKYDPDKGQVVNQNAGSKQDCAGKLYVNLTQARVILGGRSSSETMLLPDWSVGKTAVHFLDD